MTVWPIPMWLGRGDNLNDMSLLAKGFPCYSICFLKVENNHTRKHSLKNVTIGNWKNKHTLFYKSYVLIYDAHNG